MSVFAGMTDTVFADPNMASAATIVPAGGGAGISCRVVRSEPTEVRDFGGGASIASDTATFEVRCADVPAPRAGDVLTIGTESYVVQGVPQRDALRLVWTLDTRPA
jgi:hypothetical protein